MGGRVTLLAAGPARFSSLMLFRDASPSLACFYFFFCFFFPPLVFPFNLNGWLGRTVLETTCEMMCAVFFSFYFFFVRELLASGGVWYDEGVPKTLQVAAL